ncbi:hypothetical protein [Deinococcus sonorensis]|uniref:DUF3124 domain-containing protein n=2 Tax=Deinococcus sonorensis TaxID=309891 RepID=A0AAU7UBD1_9DEIO
MPTPLQPADLSAQTLLAAPTRITVDAQPLEARASAWYGTAQGNPNPFIVSVRVQTLDGAPLPAGTQLVTAYLVRGTQASQGRFVLEQNRGPQAAMQEWVSRTRADRTAFPNGAQLQVVALLNTSQGRQLLRVSPDVTVTTPN